LKKFFIENSFKSKLKRGEFGHALDIVGKPSMNVKKF
jgi:hypothetical protein